MWKKDIPKGLKGVAAAASRGAQVLAEHRSSLEAVEEAVSLMEDNSIFNAGRGSALTYAGTVEMDAAIMEGRSLSAGAVALVRNVKNPIQLARLVMEKTDHVLIVGENAERLARDYGLPTANPITSKRHNLWLKLKKHHGAPQTRWFRKNVKLLEEHPDLFSADTVGAIAVDAKGNFAAAASTGGVMMKIPGRVGDTPVIGAGLYADNLAGAATVTGVGEVAVRMGLSERVCLMMERGLAANRAASAAVRGASERLRGEAGAIAIDRRGRIAAVHNTPYMPWAYSIAKSRKVGAFRKGRILAPVSWPH